MPVDKRILFNIARLKGLSVMKLANENDISQANLSRWFKGEKGGYVKEEKIERMAKYLGINYKTGEILPGIHRWSAADSEEGVPFVIILNLLSPAGGDLVLVRITDVPLEVSFVTEDKTSLGGPIEVLSGRVEQEYIVVIPYDRSFRLIFEGWERNFQPPGIDYFIEEELEKSKSSWKFKRNKDGRLPSLTFEADEKGIFDRLENEALSIEELDTILGVEESQWTWERLVSALKAQGKVPEEVAKKLGL
jgi:transcriptional regulator with XRE-family HTH domain